MVSKWWASGEQVVSNFWASGEQVVSKRWVSVDQLVSSGEQVVSKLCASGEQMVSKWWGAGEQVVSKWWASGEQVVNKWQASGKQVVSNWWASGDLMVNKWRARYEQVQLKLTKTNLLKLSHSHWVTSLSWTELGTAQPQLVLFYFIFLQAQLSSPIHYLAYFPTAAAAYMLPSSRSSTSMMSYSTYVIQRF